MMKTGKNLLRVLLLLTLLAGCGGPNNPAQQQQRQQLRPTEALPKAVAADTITVAQFRFVCDMMARDLIRQPFVTRSSRPIVVTIRKIQNKSSQDIDEQIFQETIRARLMENAGGLVLFRDDESYRDIVQERVRQNSEEITVTLTDTVLEKTTFDRTRNQEFESGSLSGAGGSHERTRNAEEESGMDFSQTATVKSGVAAADYFLRGIIFQVNERDMTARNSGMAYFQYQFRVVDARSGLIVWEKMVSSKMAGEYQLDPQAAANQAPNAAAGQTPPGWPTGQVNQPAQMQGQSAPATSQPQTAPAQNPVEQLIPLMQQMQQLQQPK